MWNIEDKKEKKNDRKEYRNFIWMSIIGYLPIIAFVVFIFLCYGFIALFDGWLLHPVNSPLSTETRMELIHQFKLLNAKFK